MLINNLSLSANQFHKKCTVFKDIFNDGDVNRHQGLMEGTKCQQCADSAIHHSNTINCGKCNSVYHIPCLIEPIDESVSAAVKSNPCLWWICFHCLAEKTEDSVAPEVNDIDALIEKKLEKVMAGFKNDIIESIGSKFSSVINQSSSQRGIKRKAADDATSPDLFTSKVPCTTSNNVKFLQQDVPTSDVSTVSTPSYATIADHSVRPDKRNKPHNNEHSGSKHGRPSSYINQNKKFVLYYRPLVDKGLILSTEEWFQLRRTISEKLSSVKMSFSHFNPKTGKVVIGFPNQKSMDAATNLLKEVTELWCFESYIPGKCYLNSHYIMFHLISQLLRVQKMVQSKEI